MKMSKAKPKFCLSTQLDSTKNQMHAAISRLDLGTVMKLMEHYKLEPHEECFARIKSFSKKRNFH